LPKSEKGAPLSVRRSGLPKELAILQEEIAACTRCPSLRPWRKFDGQVYGNPKSGYLVVGEAPGRLSWENRRRFTGPAGLLIRRALRAVGSERYPALEDLFYMTDAVKCHPAPPGNLGANRSPTCTETRACAVHLSRELEVLKPKAIVTFGKTAAQAIRAALAQGDRIHSGPPPELIALPHPSPRNRQTIMKSYSSMQAFEDAITEVFRRLVGRLESVRP
jgi:uracil-DNA glycosylase family 4